MVDTYTKSDVILAWNRSKRTKQGFVAKVFDHTDNKVLLFDKSDINYICVEWRKDLKKGDIYINTHDDLYDLDGEKCCAISITTPEIEVCACCREKEIDPLSKAVFMWPIRGTALYFKTTANRDAVYNFIKKKKKKKKKKAKYIPSAGDIECL